MGVGNSVTEVHCEMLDLVLHWFFFFQEKILQWWKNSEKKSDAKCWQYVHWKEWAYKPAAPLHPQCVSSGVSRFSSDWRRGWQMFWFICLFQTNEPAQDCRARFSSVWLHTVYICIHIISFYTVESCCHCPTGQSTLGFMFFPPRDGFSRPYWDLQYLAHVCVRFMHQLLVKAQTWWPLISSTWEQRIP